MRMKRLVAVMLLVSLSGIPLRAQGIPVFDVQDLIEIIKIVGQVKQAYELAKDQFTTLQRMGKGLPSLARYRIPGLPFTGHDAARYPYAEGLLRMLNEGDPSYAGYVEATQHLRVPGTLFAVLPPEVQQVLRAAYAGIELTDSIATVGGHQVGITRKYHWELNNQIDALESDVTEGPAELTADLDKIAVAQLIGRRQDNAQNQLIASLLETKLAELKRKRDADVLRMNSVLNQRQDHGDLSNAMVEGATDVLRAWRIQ